MVGCISEAQNSAKYRRGQRLGLAFPLRPFRRLGDADGSGRARPKRFFCGDCGLDEQLWHELQYVIADMNCYVGHLLQVWARHSLSCDGFFRCRACL